MPPTSHLTMPSCISRWHCRRRLGAFPAFHSCAKRLSLFLRNGGRSRIRFRINYKALAGKDGMSLLEDHFGRKFPYLRLSVTDVCNFRCQYCLPNGYQKTGDFQFLSLGEIVRLVSAFAALGVEKIRLTDGEPTL